MVLTKCFRWLQKCMQTVLLVENLKPLLKTQSWTLFTHSCISLCACGRNCARIQTAKSSTNNDASEPFKNDFPILLILRLKRTGDKMLPWGTPISCSYVSDRVNPAQTWNEQSMGQIPINEGRELAPKINVVKIGRYTVFPRGAVSFFQIKENGKNVLFFWQKHYECN